MTYLGEFELVDHRFSEAHESGDPNTMRQVVVFRLRPKGDLPVDLPKVPVTAKTATRVDRVPVEERHTERAFVAPDRKPYEAERRESQLVHRYRTWLLARAHDVDRLRILPPNESSPLYCDLWDETSRELIEAKGVVTREGLRMAVGQLIDYSRFVADARLVCLVPDRPRDDLIEYLRAAQITVVYPHGDDNWVQVD